MTPDTPDPRREPLAEVARRIRVACPIRGATATNAECAHRRELIDHALADREVRAGRRRSWYTAQLVTGYVTVCWARSRDEAELTISVWRGHDCHWVVPDSHLRVYEEYFPHSRSPREPGDRVFALGVPRRVRDRFAPAVSVLASLAPAGQRRMTGEDGVDRGR